MCDDHVFIFLIRMGLIGKRKFMSFFFFFFREDCGTVQKILQDF